MATKPKGRKGYEAGSALKGAGKGAAIGTMIAPGIGTAVGGLVGGIGGWLKGRGEGKKANEQMRQQEAALNLGEDTRVNRFNAGQSLLQGLQGKGFTNISPEAAAAIGAKRDMSALVGDPLAGGGSALAGGMVDDAMDYGSQYGINKADSGSGYLGGLGISPGQPVGGLQGGFQDVMGGSGAVSMDDLMELARTRRNPNAFASGTQDFG